MKQLTTLDGRPTARLAAACAVAGMLLLGAAPAATAATYPPVEPTATSTTITPGAPASPTSTSSPTDDTDVLGERFTSGNGTDAGGSALPRTGTEIAEAAGVGAALLAGGAGLVVMGRRSRSRQH